MGNLGKWLLPILLIGAILVVGLGIVIVKSSGKGKGGSGSHDLGVSYAGFNKPMMPQQGRAGGMMYHSSLNRHLLHVKGQDQDDNISSQSKQNTFSQPSQRTSKIISSNGAEITTNGVNVSSHSDSELQHLIYLEHEKGASKEEIIKNLISVGWSKEQIEGILYHTSAKHLPTLSKKKLLQFIAYHQKKGLSRDKIEEKLTNAGWSQEIIKEYLK